MHRLFQFFLNSVAIFVNWIMFKFHFMSACCYAVNMHRCKTGLGSKPNLCDVSIGGCFEKILVIYTACRNFFCVGTSTFFSDEARCPYVFAQFKSHLFLNLFSVVKFILCLQHRFIIAVYFGSHT